MVRQSKDATCDDYFKEDSFTPFSAEPQAENPTSETSLQNSCDCGEEDRGDQRNSWITAKVYRSSWNWFVKAETDEELKLKGNTS